MNWISVKDQLPKINQFVLASYGHPVPIVLIFKEKELFLSIDLGEVWTLDDITHWMPLPEPPKP